RCFACILPPSCRSLCSPISAPRRPPTPTPPPYTTLFRSVLHRDRNRIGWRSLDVLRVLAAVTLEYLEQFLAQLLGLLGGQSQHRSEEHTSALPSRFDIVCRLLPEKQEMRIS